MSYESWALRRFPRFLRGPWGSSFVTAVTGVVQAAEDAIRDAVSARYAASAPADALPYLARDCDVPHLVESESLGALRDRLADPWGWHDKSGKATGVDAVLETVGFPSADTYIVDRSLGESWCHASGWWSLWWVATRNPTTFDVTSDTFDSDGVSTWDDEPADCWDYTCHPSVWQSIRANLWKYKWAHGVPVCVSVIFGDAMLFDDGVFTGDTWDEADGFTWDEGVATSTHEVVRLADQWDIDPRPATDTFDPLNRTWDQDEADGLTWSARVSA